MSGARHCPRQGAARTRRFRRRRGAKKRGRGAARSPWITHDPGARPSSTARSASRFSAAWRSRSPPRSSACRRPTTCRPRSPAIFAATICPCRCAPAPTPRSRRCRGSASRIWSAGKAPPTGATPWRCSHAFAGVAETGTLVLLSGPDNPTTLNFLPDTHIVMLSADDVAGDYETVWRRLRERYGPGALPRTVNLITGPSRSADIEQTLILGAHGPRALHILVVG